MTDASRFTKSLISKTTVDIFLSGYLLDAEMIKHLCILKYGATQAELQKRYPLDFALCYYGKRDVLDAPWLVPIMHSGKDWWLLPGKAVFFVAGTNPPDLPMDRETKAYLNTWFPPDLLKRPEFEGLRYVQTFWPRDIPPAGIVRTKLRMVNKEARLAREQYQQKYLDYQMSRGRTDIKMPPLFPVVWLID
ncbi:hypothetical protein C8Q74DRAFT_1371389 [Fomes fomentarius]|nr:hypothetical protein C8Q74DRAFT_1371389 [Fomes fomentarius]